jgi:membrane-associated phospholipid phosphatase
MSWHLVTRLGEAQILVPAALMAAVWLTWRLGAGETARIWLTLLGLVTALTTLSKLAFIGWGVGVASMDFTGFSGHAMFAAGVYPMLARVSVANAPAFSRRIAVALGVTLAVVIAFSRLELRAHSLSEVISGSLLGFVASGVALCWQPITGVRGRPWMPMVLALGLVLLPWKAPPNLSHRLVTQLALKLSHRVKPHTRADLHRCATESCLQQVGRQS